MRYLLLAVIAGAAAAAGIGVIYAATGPECTTTIQVGGAYVLLPVSAVSSLYGDITATDTTAERRMSVIYSPAKDEIQVELSWLRLLSGVLVGLLAILLFVRKCP